MGGEATLELAGTFSGEAIRFLIPSVAQHAASNMRRSTSMLM